MTEHPTAVVPMLSVRNGARATMLAPPRLAVLAHGGHDVKIVTVSGSAAFGY
ncbi:MAG TPA: hypothetical protein VEL51_04645 [Vicinamibacterales bacterium]|nr:hypothetical protein [Vicinamibacterales bacterium]